MSGDLVRASDDDRDRTVLVLREHLAAGRLTLEEFTERMTAALAATTTADLDAPLRELPVPAGQSRRGPSRFVVSIFSSVVRKGRLRLGRRIFCFVAFGNIDLDLRDATLERNALTIVAFGFWATMDVYVPEGIEADIGGLVVFGHRNAHGNDLPPVPGSPLVRFDIFGLFSGIDLWRVPLAWGQRTFREVIRGIRRGEHQPKELES
ncbi:MAG TPA: DUF1707 domain-containing protein [Gaiellaceae bacterium]|nr:DUF1707 domain-containing protein [Gaiellaceae bacterium]